MWYRKGDTEQQKVINQTLFTAASQITVIKKDLQVIKENIRVIKKNVRVVNNKVEIVQMEMKVMKSRMETLEVQVETITADVVKLNDLIKLKKEHTRAINHIGVGIECMMAHLNLTYGEN